MKVLKFGGTSVGSPESIRIVADIARDYLAQEVKFAIVTSALGGITNQLIQVGETARDGKEDYHQLLDEIYDRHVKTAKALFEKSLPDEVNVGLEGFRAELEDLLHGISLLKELSPRTLDLLVSFGERMAAFLISKYFNSIGIAAENCDARQLIITDSNFGHAKVYFGITDANIKDHFKHHNALQIVTGFVSSTEKGETTTLGRGGSDYTAAILAAALEAGEIEIWTDVDGVMTTDPRKVKDAFPLAELSFIEAMEMSHFGAKVIYPPTILPAYKRRIPIRIRNTFNRESAGTLISENPTKRDYLIKGISSIPEIALINLQGSGMVGVPGVSSRLFGVLARNSINIILITQASSEHSICFAIDPKDAKLAQRVIEEEFELEIQSQKIDPLIVEKDLSIVAIIGENMKHTPGISAKLFGSMGKNGINIVAIAQGSSELNLSVVIKKEDISKALNTLHEAFFLSDVKSLNLFIVGVGLIGGTLLAQIKQQYEYLLKEQFIKINVIALARSKKMHFNTDGISLEHWKDTLEDNGMLTNLDEFVKDMIEMNLSNSVFVDCTSSPDVIHHYEEILDESISVVTPNKLASSGPYENFTKLHETAFKRGAKYLYETNVGAGLPVISTLRDLKYSGDKILKIEGVLSGTLSYIFNSFDGTTPFNEVVKVAKEKGYTEPDPRDDLNGMDVARKILILSREVGISIELDDVQVENILPQTCLDAETIDEFFEALENANDIFEERLNKAKAENKVLRFIATAENGQANVSLQAVGPDHPFYSLSGSDNMISYTTDRYKERPLVVKGPGAGAEVTAAGVFAEIISISNYLS